MFGPVTTRLTIEYDGTDFRGWAKQPGVRTIQQELETALQIVRREETRLTVAGRTDAGVHAWAQVASHPGDPANVRSINALLPDDIAVLSSEEADESFDARSDATSRTYCYRLWNHRERPALMRGRVLWCAYRLDQALLNACAELLLGQHDFEAFTLAQQPYEHYRRTVRRAEWVQGERLLEFWIEGDKFTRRMVRSLVSIQIDVARRARPIEDFARLLDGAPRAEGGGTAPAHGLYLASVGFGDAT
ncbi:MAG: tRNA pseudouridine(38-40) synthase TruA [Solirubrobacterales bacterium]|nr:tRNA pseudouridine(38-40) synthase TruA [Solirubrobacterales bacterium]